MNLEAEAAKYNLPISLIMDLRGWYFSRVVLAIDLHPHFKINCMCYLAMNRSTFFERLIKQDLLSINDVIECANMEPKILLYFRRRIKKDENLKKRIIDAVKPEWYDFLPCDIAKDPVVMKRCNRTGKIYDFYDRDSQGYNRDWVNKNGQLLSFFHLGGNFPIRTKADYYKIYKEYIKSQKSVNAFCKQFRIEPVEGFRKFLERITAEKFDDFSEVSKVKNTVKTNFWNASKKAAIKLANGELSFEDFFNNNSINFNDSNIILYCRTLSQEERSKFSIQMMQYFDRNYPIFPQKFIDFLTANKNAIENYNYFIKGGLIIQKDRNYYSIFHNQEFKLKQQFTRCVRKNVYCNLRIGDKVYEIDDNIIDQALTYATDMGYHVCQVSIMAICKKIVMGELDYTHETVEQKDEMIDVLLKLVSEEKTIEDYISVIKNNKSMI